MAPDEASTRSSAWYSIDVSIEKIAAIRNYREIYIARRSIRGTTGTQAAFECNVITFNFIVPSPVCPISPKMSFERTALIYQHNCALVRSNDKRVTVHADILRSGDQDVIPPKPPAMVP